MSSNRVCRTLAAALLALAASGCATLQQPAAEDANTLANARAAWEQQDYEQAMILMRAEAERGTPEAQYALGYMYYNGQGTDPDVEQAMHWIQRAAEQGHPPAIRALGQLASIGAQRPHRQAAPERAPQTPAVPEG